MIRATDIHSLTDFQRNAKGYIRQVRETKNPLAITVNGKAEVVVQDAAQYQQMVDELERAQFVRAIRESEADIAAGRVYDADEIMEELRAELGFSD